MTLFAISLVGMLLFGFPFMVTLLGSLILYLFVYMPDFAPKMIITMVQQVITGVTPPALVCVPTRRPAHHHQCQLYAFRCGFGVHPGNGGGHWRHHAPHAFGGRV